MNALNLLTEQYGQRHRHYHTLEHIAYMFRKAKEHGVSLNKAQIQAIWWHDASYTPGSSINEEDSCLMMECYIDPTNIDTIRAKRMILDTKDHEPKSLESAIVCDLDMLILAESKVAYRRYAKQIRAEWSHIPSTKYKLGRLEFLEKLRMTPIFFSHTFLKYRMKAIENIDMEIKTLKRSS